MTWATQNLAGLGMPVYKAAQIASAATGVLPSVIIAQWEDETGNGTSFAFRSGNNFAGVSAGGSVNGFPTQQAGLNAYIATLNQSIYNNVRQANGWRAQCVQLGNPNPNAEAWSAARYNAQAYNLGLPLAVICANAGIDLINDVLQGNLTQYDGAQAQNTTTDSVTATTALEALPPIQPPPLGTASSVITGDFTIDGQSFDLNITKALVAPQLDLSTTQASTFSLTLSDPDGDLLNSGLFSQKSIVNFGTSDLSFSLVSVEKEDTVLTVTFEAFVVAALRTAVGPITVAAGQMTRTDFAGYLVGQIVGAGFNCPPESWLYAQDDGYDRPTQETISRGTEDLPYEDSWTCLGRLADEIDWIVFESLGEVYFGPQTWLAQQPPVMTPVDGQNGIERIDGTFDIGQPTGDLTITCTADSWIAGLGDAVLLTTMGPMNGTWIVTEIERDNMLEPDLTITISIPQPSLPEPASGGAAAAVGAGDNPGTAASQQSLDGSAAAQQAIAYNIAQLGKPYVYGGESPSTGFDCSGLQQEAYASAGIPIPRTTFTQWADSSLAHVPAGIGNLRPGDLVYFAGSDGSANNPGHVAIVTKINTGTNDVIVIDAYETGDPIRYDHFGYVNPGGNTAFAGTYVGAIRPAP